MNWCITMPEKRRIKFLTNLKGINILKIGKKEILLSDDECYEIVWQMISKLELDYHSSDYCHESY